MTVVTPDPQHSPAAVTISIAQIYATLLEVRTDVQDIKHSVERVGRETADHETRIRSLERKVWIAAGAASGLTALVTQVLTAQQ